MKYCFSLLLLITVSCSFGQSDTIVKFYNRSWKETNPELSTYFMVAFRKDNYWQRQDYYTKSEKIQMVGYYEDDSLQIMTGPFKYYYENGQVKSEGRYQKNKKIGTWRGWHEKGEREHEAYYNSEGILFGHPVWWYQNGAINDSFALDENGNGKGEMYYDNGKLLGKGTMVRGQRQGDWTYYYDNGNKSQETYFEKDSAIRFACYDEKGNIQTKDCYYERESEFPGPEGAWLSYLQKAMGKYLPKEYFDGKIWGVCEVQFIVDKEGKVTEPSISSSTEPKLNEAALKIIRNSPKWIPGVQYNRKVKTFKIQPLVFQQAVEE